MADVKLSSTNKNSFRPLANFAPNIWKETNIFNSTLSNSEIESRDRLVEKMKQKVKESLITPTSDPAEKVRLINSICRLGVSYHFETEIEQQLNQIFETHPNLIEDNGYDLFTVALLFRVFRQHGYRISCGVFKKFKNNEGKFEENLTEDVRGMLSLYEATQLRIHGEDILEEALDFTIPHLKSLAAKSSPHLAKHIVDALEHPLHKCVPRVQARRYISFYEEDHEYRNETLLLFAKLDFNRVQLLHQQELSHLTSWSIDSNFASKFPYSRDRIVEVYSCSAAVYFEPCYSHARIIHTKVMSILTIVDDTYDAYGTLEELQSFTDAIKRWDTSAINDLPDYMKTLYSIVLNLFDELDDDAKKDGRSFIVSYAKDKLKELVGAYFVESKWFNEGVLPSFDERLSNGIITATCFYGPAIVFLGMGEIAGTLALEWLNELPKIVRAVHVIVRVGDDIVSYKFEEDRGHVASTVECYMKEYGVSREEAIEKLHIMMADAWKEINEECFKPTVVPMQLLLTLVNTARLMEVFYKYRSSITVPEAMKDYNTMLFVDQIPV